MLEFLTGTGLAVAAGLNAYLPLLVLGAVSGPLGLVDLPEQWMWLENGWALVIVAVLLTVELIADKIPIVDSINDWIQTVVRPASGGIVFGTGAASETVAVRDPAEFFSTQQWFPVLAGVLIALGVHLVKMVARPALNAMTGGLAAPGVSVLEDLGSLVLAVLAIVLPVLVVAAIAGMAVGIVMLFRRIARRERRLSAGITTRRPAPGDRGPAS